MEKNLQLRSSFHLAGVIPVAGQSLDFNFPWHDCLQPIGKNYLAVERAALECAYAGCETIWIVCHDEMQPLIKYRLGEYIEDPVRNYSSYTRLPTDLKKQIPIFYVPIHPKDRDKRDCLAWSVLHGANSCYWLSKTISKWVIPDRYYVAFPYGVYLPNVVKKHRQEISSKKGYVLSYEGRTIREGEYLGFTFDSEDYMRFKNIIREEGTGEKFKGQGYENVPRLPIEERWSARFFSLDKVFKPVIVGEENVNVVEVSWYYNIDNWSGLCEYLGSEEKEELRKPNKKILNGNNTFYGIGVDNDED